MRWTHALTAAALSASWLVTACGGPPEAAASPQGRQLTPAHVAGLFVVESRTLGAIVVDGQGYVLYRYDSDSADPPRSTCVDSCTNHWPPVPAVDGLTVIGIDRQLVGRLTRPDGSAQLTLAGWPLYGYAGDRMPGDTNGQRLDNTWFVIDPNGDRVSPAVAPRGAAG